MKRIVTDALVFAMIVLAAAGSGLDRVVKTTVFLRDMKDFAAMNEVYARRFCGSVAPARAAVEVSALPKNARVEIEAVAFVPDAPSGGVVSACAKREVLGNPPAPLPGSCVV